MNALIITKPSTSDAGGKALRDALSRHFAEAHSTCEIYETREGENLADTVRLRLRDGFDCIVAAGGDGTVSAVSDGLIGSTAPLGIIPMGTGNLIAQELCIPSDVEAAVALIAGASRARTIDAMRIGKRAFVLNTSVGISASVVRETTRGNKSRFGRIAYIGTAVLKLPSSRPRYLVVEVDGNAHPYRAIEASVMNCGLLGRRFYPKGPEIQIDDGHLGVWILSMRTWRDYLHYVVGVIAGWPLKREAQFLRAGRTVSIRSNHPIPVQADGDIIGKTPVDITVLPGALTVLVPLALADVEARDESPPQPATATDDVRVNS